MLPAASAGPSFQAAMFIGKFQGTISPTTPIGSRSVKSRPGAGDRDRLAEVLVGGAGVVLEHEADRERLAARRC